MKPKISSAPENRNAGHHMSENMEIMKLKQTEIYKMITRAKSSGLFHGINMRHGSPNPGQGDCAFEAIIQNNNDRSCFVTKYPMNINFYRKIWTKEMADRTVNSPYNTLGSHNWYKGWKEMSMPGVYERGIFGDLILPGIACGIKKILLIFNTSLKSPHDPIYVIDPSNFNVSPDTQIPILLAYNLVHYESMEPCSNSDIEATIKLVKDYQTGRYQFSRKDFPLLFGINIQASDREDKKMTETDELVYKQEYQSLKFNNSRQQIELPVEETNIENPKKRVCKKSNKSMNT